MTRRRAWRRLGTVVAAVAFVLLAGYALQGRQFLRFRWLRARTAAFLEPPTQAEMRAAAVADSASKTTNYAPPPGYEPASPREMLGWTAGVLVLVLLLALVSARRGGKGSS